MDGVLDVVIQLILLEDESHREIEETISNLDKVIECI